MIQLPMFPETDALYFAFGSNMDETQMVARCPTARPIDLCWLQGHELVFRGHSVTWGGGVASVDPCESKYVVAGVLWTMSTEDLETLDLYEGTAYERTEVDVRGRGARGEHEINYRAYTYRIPFGRLPETRPTRAYLGQIRRAYRRWGFDRSRLPARSFAVKPRRRRVDRSGLVVPPRPANEGKSHRPAEGVRRRHVVAGGPGEAPVIVDRPVTQCVM